MRKVLNTDGVLGPSVDVSDGGGVFQGFFLADDDEVGDAQIFSIGELEGELVFTQVMVGWYTVESQKLYERDSLGHGFST